MDEQETIRREGRILGGSLIVGIAVGLGLPSFVTNTLHLSLPDPVWRIVLIVVGVGLINSGMTKSRNAEVTRRNKTIFLILIAAILAGVIIWRFLGK